MASPFPEHGIVADTYLHRPHTRAKNRRIKHMVVLSSALGFALVLLSRLTLDVPQEDAASKQYTAAEQANDSYEFAVYTLNHTSKTATQAWTAFTFDTTQLPFEFEDLLFGEHRGDTEFSSRYYAGMSLLAWAEGSRATVRFLESGGKEVDHISYQGQFLIVLNGWERVSVDGQGNVIEHAWGSMQIPAYDWRDGSWSPEDGIIAEHPTNVTFSSATLCVMVYEPSKSTDIPEFGLLPVCISVVLLTTAAERLRR